MIVLVQDKNVRIAHKPTEASTNAHFELSSAVDTRSLHIADVELSKSLVAALGGLAIISPNLEIAEFHTCDFRVDDSKAEVSEGVCDTAFPIDILRSTRRVVLNRCSYGGYRRHVELLCADLGFSLRVNVVLEELVLEQMINQLKKESLSSFTDALAFDTQLRELRLVDNIFTDLGELADALEKPGSRLETLVIDGVDGGRSGPITELCMRFQNFRAIQAIQLLHHKILVFTPPLTFPPSLVSFSTFGSGLTESGLVDILRAATACPSLLELTIGILKTRQSIRQRNLSCNTVTNALGELLLQKRLTKLVVQSSIGITQAFVVAGKWYSTKKQLAKAPIAVLDSTELQHIIGNNS